MSMNMHQKPTSSSSSSPPRSSCMSSPRSLSSPLSLRSPRSAWRNGLKTTPSSKQSPSSSWFVRNEMKRINGSSRGGRYVNPRKDGSKIEQQHHEEDEKIIGTEQDQGHQKLPQRWVDSFCIIGLSRSERRRVVELCIQQQQSDNTDEQKQRRRSNNKNITNITCTPSLLDRYPRTNQDDFDFPDQLSAFCFPQTGGSCTAIVFFQQQHQMKNRNQTEDGVPASSSSLPCLNIPEPRLCSTVLTSSKGHRLYLSTLTVYEKMRTLDLDDCDDDDDEVHESRKKSFSSTANSEARGPKRVKTDHNWVDWASPQQRQQQDGEISATSSSAIKDEQKDVTIWIPKVLVLLSHHPYFHAQTTVLKELYYTVSSGNSPVPFERYVAHIVDAIPMPSISHYTTTATAEESDQDAVSLHGSTHQISVIEWRSWIGLGSDREVKFRLFPPWTYKSKLVCHDGLNPQHHRYFDHKPFHVPLEALFRTLSLSNILVLFATLIQEGKVVLSCHPNNAALLTPIAEALLDLLFPFKWQGLYIPLLPATVNMESHWSEVESIDILDAPLPFLVGVTTTDLSKLRQPPGVVWCDLDQDVLHLGYNDDGSFVESIPAMPEKAAMKLKVELEEVADPLYLPCLNGIKGEMTTGDRTVMLENALREPYALCTKLFDDLHPSAQAFSRAYILSQANVVPRGKPLDHKDFVVTYDPEIQKNQSFCCYTTSEEEPVDTELENRIQSNNEPPEDDFSMQRSPLKDFTNSLVRSGRQLQTQADRFLAVIGHKEYATPSLWAAKASTDVDFAQDALKRQDEIAARFFQLTDNEHALTDRVRSSFESFYVSVFPGHLVKEEGKNDMLDFGRYVRSMGLSREQQHFERAITETQMFDVFLNSDKWNESFLNPIFRKSAHITGVKPSEKIECSGVSILHVPHVCAAGIRIGEKFCQDRRFPDTMTTSELLVEIEPETPRTLWLTLLDSALMCCSS